MICSSDYQKWSFFSLSLPLHLPVHPVSPSHGSSFTLSPPKSPSLFLPLSHLSPFVTFLSITRPLSLSLSLSLYLSLSPPLSLSLSVPVSVYQSICLSIYLNVANNFLIRLESFTLPRILSRYGPSAYRFIQVDAVIFRRLTIHRS